MGAIDPRVRSARPGAIHVEALRASPHGHKPRWVMDEKVYAVANLRAKVK